MTDPAVQQGLEQWAQSCAKIPVGVYMAYCMGRAGKGAQPITAPWSLKSEPISIQDVVSLLCALGHFEPATLQRPGACDIVTSFDDIVEVEPATIAGECTDAEVITPSEQVLIKICAPQNKALVVDFLEGIAANLTAWESGEVVSKSMQVAGFSEAFCPAGEPGPGQPSNEGVFSQVRRIVLCPGSGFDLTARNHSPYSPALFHIKGVMWTTC